MIIVNKPWGNEHQIVTNENYTGKLLNISSGQETSKQYHREKHETLFLIKGKAQVLINGVEVIVDAEKTPEHDRIFVIPPGTIHRTRAVDGDCTFVEFSTSQLEDVVRVSDLYQRIE